MATRPLIIVAVLLLVALAGVAVLAVPRLTGPSGTHRLVDETTLAVIRGDVQLQRAGGVFGPVTADTTVRPGDRVRTGTDAYAAITYFDGSSTTIEPNTEILVARLNDLGAGGADISVKQEIGQTWNRVERLVGATSRFETTTSAGVAFVRGTEYRVSVEISQLTVVEAVSGTLFVEAAGVTVTLEAGFTTTIVPGQAPSPPARATPPRAAVRIDVSGPVRLFLVDDRGRSTGLHPLGGALVSQIPGVAHTTRGGRTTILIPNPVADYEIILSADADGGTYSIDFVDLAEGEPATGATDPRRLAGSIGRGQHQATRFQVQDSQTQAIQPASASAGAPLRGRVLLAQRVLATGTPGAALTPTPQTTATPSRSPTATTAPSPEPTQQPAAERSTPPTSVPGPPTPVEPTALPPTIAPTLEPTALPPTLAPTRPPLSQATPTALETGVVTLINDTRQEQNLPPLMWDPDLAQLARDHTEDMISRNYFDHINPDGEDPDARLSKAGVEGYRPGVFWGENLSTDASIGQAHRRDLKEPIEPGNHHGNIVDPRFTRVGAGVTQLPGGQVLITVLFLPPP